MPARAVLLAGLVLAGAALPARAAEPAFESVGRPRRPPARTVPAPAPPGPAVVSGYLPRNHSVPMYNEPPPRLPAW